MVEVGSLLIAESVSGVRVTITVVEALVVMVEDVLLAPVFEFVAAAAPAPVDEYVAPSLWSRAIDRAHEAETRGRSSFS